MCVCMSIDHPSPCPVLYSSGTKVTTVVPLSYVDCLVQLGLIFPGYSTLPNVRPQLSDFGNSLKPQAAQEWNHLGVSTNGG